MKVRLSSTARDIRLLEGEALFKVQHDPNRPFCVRTDDAVIQAIGTQFDVYRQVHNTRVEVLEGAVRISAEEKNDPSTHAADETASAGDPVLSAATISTVSAGEEANISQAGSITRLASEEITNKLAWRQRRLVFREDSLSFIVGEFNRYNRHPRFRIVDREVGNLRYTGVFDVDDPGANLYSAKSSELETITDRYDQARPTGWLSRMGW